MRTVVRDVMRKPLPTSKTQRVVVPKRVRKAVDPKKSRLRPLSRATGKYSK